MSDPQKRIDEIAEIMWDNLYSMMATGQDALLAAMEIAMDEWSDTPEGKTASWMELTDGEEVELAEFAQAIGQLAQRISDEGLIFTPAYNAGRVKDFNR